MIVFHAVYSYSSVNDDKLADDIVQKSNTRTNYGYALVDKDTNEILKFGETIHPSTRYSQTYLDANNARMVIIEQGNKLDIHLWQHDMNEYFFYKYNEYPMLNSGGW